MGTIPFFSPDPELFREFAALLPADLAEYFDLAHLDTPARANEFLSLEFPELVVIDFRDPAAGGMEILAHLRSDPWMLSCGILTIQQRVNTAAEVPELQAANFLVGLPQGRLADLVPRILRILHQNAGMLVQRFVALDLAATLVDQFSIENEPLVAMCHANMIVNYLYNLHRISDKTKLELTLVFTELMQNAIEHGNCGISYAEKTAWLENGGDIQELIDRRCEDPAIASRRVRFEYEVTAPFTSFLIADEGAGFDWQNRLEGSEGGTGLQLHGRGLQMVKQLVQDLEFNEPGNEVRFKVPHQIAVANMAPGLFRNRCPIVFTPGETVFREGEPSDSLYYIMKGRFSVNVHGKTVATLGPADLFVGEMSFLLNRRRTATVTAETAGSLLSISRREFVEAIREKPQYALVLSRLLAQRLERQNQHRADV
ncbi:MAG TPA: cyclic nucleotide-binding domain-containing protein [Candidatus Ozemobacteraceae bacterium]|nr:cyclic nucleotide-binding domain-containing protein [Candidatus Ozemobacteraceae bacterium]HQG27131.1 cyclic nucleotide-binding domain-containing protein [Candidatus Ozemobacteraceae bacterium]